jgi:ubiquinol-cytochrome c reductase cytochrome c subunit
VKRSLLLVGVILLAATVAPAVSFAAGRQPDGRTVFVERCASCHGTDGTGTAWGVSLRAEGVASIDFQVRTGRMPLARPGDVPRRGAPALSPAEIDALIAFAPEITDGPRIPSIDPGRGDSAEGVELFLTNCAACHGATGRGGALIRAINAPPLTRATPLEIAEAVRSGPGSMPRFDATTIDAAQLDSLVLHVESLQHLDDRGGWSLWHLGPVPEGLVAWLLGLGTLLIVLRWIGTTVARRREIDGTEDAP